MEVILAGLIVQTDPPEVSYLLIIAILVQPWLGKKLDLRPTP